MSIDLDEVLRALEMNNPYLNFYLNKKTGKISVVSSLSEDADTKSMEQDTDTFIRLPATKDLDMLHMMQEFLPLMKDPAQRTTIAASLDAGHSLKQLEDELADMDMRQHWYTFQNMKYRDFAMEWCKTNGLAYE
ncbi:MAG: UPF0158 family protein [Megasphaera sp.]|jgi:hypothetical protein|nr:UPF0158 family protein [Megasphaera sp.]MCH4218587.1 UPF0158 family protein [Megasphaera sp.]